MSLTNQHQQLIQCFQISMDDFKEIVKEAVISVIPMNSKSNPNRDLEDSSLDPKDDLVTPKEVMNLLKISSTTLWRFNKNGTLKKKKKIGRKVYYSAKDINNLLNDSAQ